MAFARKEFPGACAPLQLRQMNGRHHATGAPATKLNGGEFKRHELRVAGLGSFPLAPLGEGASPLHLEKTGAGLNSPPPKRRLQHV